MGQLGLSTRVMSPLIVYARFPTPRLLSLLHFLQKLRQLGLALLHKLLLSRLFLGNYLMLLLVGHGDDGQDQVDQVEGAKENGQDEKYYIDATVCT